MLRDIPSSQLREALAHYNRVKCSPEMLEDRAAIVRELERRRNEVAHAA